MSRNDMKIYLPGEKGVVRTNREFDAEGKGSVMYRVFSEDPEEKRGFIKPLRKGVYKVIEIR